MKFAAIAAAAILAAACASLDEKPRGPELFAVIPHGADGHIGSIVVHRAGKSQVVNTAYGAERIDGEGARRTTISAEDVKRDFADTLAALPGHLGAASKRALLRGSFAKDWLRIALPERTS